MELSVISSEPQPQPQSQEATQVVPARKRELKRDTSRLPNEVFTRLPTKPPVDIRFDNVGYTASLGFRKGKKKILHEVCGRFVPKQLIAIMGPSGAGKSTLLDILSGYRLTGVTGSVLVNGVERQLDEFRRLSCYITQDDRLQELLTVHENMLVAADLKLGEDTDLSEKAQIVEETLRTLGLWEARKTLAGRLSGGQKKRMSIALELICNPLVMFLDEPTTGLDSSTCAQVVYLLKLLARQGRTIVCTIHQPSASLFQLFDHVYVLARGECLYQGSADNLVPYLSAVQLPCPMYHNPADYVIELACGDYGEDKIDRLVEGTENGRTLQWFAEPEALAYQKPPRRSRSKSLGFQKVSRNLQETSQLNQLKVLLRRGFIKVKRDQTLTHMRLLVNILTGIMLGVLFIEAGDDGARVLDNYNLLFGILMHHMMTTMMLTILTFPMEMNILKKEHFNRWYSLKSYYVSTTIVDIPVAVLCCAIFSVLVYLMSSQPLVWERFGMFFAISMLVVFVAQSFGLMIGAVFSVVNGTFLGPTLSVPMMMFAGFGVTLRDLPPYLYWGSYISYLRYGLEGYVTAIYGMDRPKLDCSVFYCHYRIPSVFLDTIAMGHTPFWVDVVALCGILLALRVAAYFLLRWKLYAVR
ncbi:ATP-binding cassette subfamily G member 4 [Schistocerca americana]|uniref:ATP-binding cassette subfamily G member 4 n=1 Tax=Schistocerca americana TaxID=7009 RepID=UPI001F4F5B58|nr:ATP-binding cassette subfamily G member 4 [Schistocerca americana]